MVFYTTTLYIWSKKLFKDTTKLSTWFLALIDKRFDYDGIQLTQQSCVIQERFLLTPQIIKVNVD